MSRVGRKPIEMPKGVKVEVVGQQIKVEGPKGKLERQVRPEIKVVMVDGVLSLSRVEESRFSRAYHGMERAFVNNMVLGVSRGFDKELELIGVGYRADIQNNMLNLALGHSHAIDFPLPTGVKGSVVKDGRQIFIKLEGIDKQLVGQVAAQIRSLRSPEPYKGKGVRYKGEIVITKAGKTGKK